MSKDTNGSSESVKNTGNIQKPLPVAKQEFLENVVKLINGSNLPVFVIEYIINDIYSEVKSAAQKEYEQSKKYYESAISNDSSFAVQNNEV